MCTRHKPLCLEEPIWLWIYLPNFKWNQNWLLHIQKPSTKRKRAKVVSCNLIESILMFLWFLWWQKRSVPSLQLQRVSKTENRGKKINFASFIPLQITKFQKFWVPEYFLYQCTLVIFPLPVHHFWLLLLQLFLFLCSFLLLKIVFFMDVNSYIGNKVDLTWLD